MMFELADHLLWLAPITFVLYLAAETVFFVKKMCSPQHNEVSNVDDSHKSHLFLDCLHVISWLRL